MPISNPTRRGNEHPINLTDEQRTRFWSRVNKTPGGCWEWLGSLSRDGYGVLWLKQAKQVGFAAHRIGWTLSRGPIPVGATVDHLCRNPKCVNPDHLEITTNKENILRGASPTAINAKKTHCKHGHEFTPENTRFWQHEKHLSRQCRTCGIERNRARRQRLKA